ncbi:DUF2147 domain-containing protein [Erythrobacter sp. WG]|uniref:DUF2147 domain-containing protein n=1 Tax=Erythrobacter sp. WG TaxID=2985510 RepID=UPI00226E406B|nr:DUF2147 domain-containing protein [Erythrobacter sp. WG]MCX9148616.1 DUF2147 domain-containing protein [Erythrobacter sp. WG]
MKTVAVALTFALAAFAVPAAAAEPITGRWVTAEKDAVVNIAKCGKALCGTIERFLILPKGGKDQRDVNNSDPAKRTRKLIGTPVLTGLTAADALWKGQVYDPKSGKTYTSEVRRKDAATLEVKGCVGFLCQTQVWKKAS